MRRVIVESPYSGDVAANVDYARQAVKDCIDRGESPLASHLLLTQVLNDLDPEQRKTGIAAGIAWYDVADASVIYYDRGVSLGMIEGIRAARAAGVRIELRSIHHRDDIFL